MSKRLNKEIRRSTRVVGIFPNPKSYLRLVTMYLIEYSEDWSITRSYLSENRLNHSTNRQHGMVGGIQSCELDLTVPENAWEYLYLP
jgi:hypothetical protein